MTARDIYLKWAPLHQRWVEWVRPVPFVGMTKEQINAPCTFALPVIHYLDSCQEGVAIIVDLPGAESVLEGLACAKSGYRPIPLFNGTTPQKNAMALVDTASVQNALIWGAKVLGDMAVAADAPPVFLVDALRLLRYRMSASLFDNSWDLYAQDIPSAEYFHLAGMNTILIRSDKVNRDLARILYPYQQKGIAIQFTDGIQPPRSVHLRKPARIDKFQ